MSKEVQIKGLRELGWDDRVAALSEIEKALKIHGEAEGDHPDANKRRLEEKFISALDANKLFNGLMEFLKTGKFEKGLKTSYPGYAYKPDGTPFTIEELETLDWFIQKFFGAMQGSARYLAIAAFLVGKMTEEAQKAGKQVKIDIDSMPKDYYELRKNFNLTTAEINAIKWGEIHVAEAITRTGENTRHAVREIVVEARKTRKSISTLRQELRDKLLEMDSPDGLQRDFRRVAITESNRIANEGHLSIVPVGGYVIGVSLPDACGWCHENINGKVLRKIDAPPPEYANLDPQSEKYKAIALIWETCIWSGKSNMGRGAAKRKRVAGKLIPREHHELAMPATHDHPNGRCAWTEYYPDIFFVKKNGQAGIRSSATEDEYLKWFRGFEKKQDEVTQALGYVERMAA